MFKKLQQWVGQSPAVLMALVLGIVIGVAAQWSGDAGPVQAQSSSCQNAICVPAGDTAQWRAGNIVLNTSGQYANGLLVPYGNVGIGTIAPQAKFEVFGNSLFGGRVLVGAGDPAKAPQLLTVQGNIQSNGLCIGTTCITKWEDLKTVLGIDKTTPNPTEETKSCPIWYSGSGNDCMTGGNSAQIKTDCCGSGTMTKCVPTTGGVLITGTGCAYNPPKRYYQAPMSEGRQTVNYYASMPLGSAFPTGTVCYGENVYYTNADQRGGGGLKLYCWTEFPELKSQCTYTGCCIKADVWRQACS